MTKTSYLALLLLLSGPVAMAADEEFQISPRLGKGNLQIHSDLPVDHTAVDVDTFGAGITFGYVTPYRCACRRRLHLAGQLEFFRRARRLPLARIHHRYRLSIRNAAGVSFDS